MLIRIIGLWLPILVLFLPLSVTAQQIPPGMEVEVLALFAPYGVEAPSDQVQSATIASISIEKSTISVTITRDGKSAQLRIGGRGIADRELLAQSRSFDIWLDEPVADAALLAACETLARAVQTNDTGSFWGQVPEPEKADKAESVAAQIAGRYFWHDFIGEFLLLALLTLFVLTRRQFIPLLAGRPRLFWLGLFLVFCLGTTYRFTLASKEVVDSVLPDEECGADFQCDDFNPCTADRCVEQICRFDWAPPEDSACCTADADCAPAVDRCVEIYCSAATNLCTQRNKAECEIDPYEGQSRPPSNTSVGWLYAVAAKYMGNTATTAAAINAVLSSLALLMLAFALLAWGATANISLGAAFLYAVLPLPLVASQTASMTGFLLFFLLLLMLALAPLVRAKPPDGRQCYWLAALIGLLFFVLVSARPDGFLLVPLFAIALLSSGAHERVHWKVFATLGLTVVFSLVTRLLLLAPTEFYGAFPMWAAESVWTNLLTGLDVVFVQGLAVPFLLILLALLGVPAAYRRNRPLFWLSFIMFLGIPLYLAFFDMTRYQVVRYSMIPGISLVILGSYGLGWLGSRRIKFAWLAVVILVAYFSYFPLSRVEKLRHLAASPLIDSHYFQI